MTHRLQRELQRELNERLPRGSRGSLQNELRMRFWIWRLTGHSFDDSVAKAVDGIRQSTPGFEPLLLPVTARLSPSSLPAALPVVG
jgi:hypothetical protein